jgi:predicted metalloendopeptidase
MLNISFPGFPDYILNKEELDDQYEGLEVKPDEYFENNIAFNVFSLRNDLKKLDQPVNKTKWGQFLTLKRDDALRRHLCI